MGYPSAIAFVLLSMLAAAALSYSVHRLVQVDARRRHQEVGVTVFLQLGVLFAVLLAFVFSEAYSEYGNAQRAIDLECGALHGTAILASTLPPDEAHNLLGLEADYLRNVVNLDWPTMRRHRRGSRDAMLSLMQLMQHVARVPITATVDDASKSQLLSLLATAHAEREVRLFEAANGLPAVVWAVLFGYSIILITFVAFSGLERPLALMLFALTFAACIGAILVLVRLLDYPFEGPLAIPPTDFVTRLAMVLDLLNAR
jgi:hypothetical protein